MKTHKSKNFTALFVSFTWMFYCGTVSLSLAVENAPTCEVPDMNSRDKMAPVVNELREKFKNVDQLIQEKCDYLKNVSWSIGSALNFKQSKCLDLDSIQKIIEGRHFFDRSSAQLKKMTLEGGIIREDIKAVTDANSADCKWLQSTLSKIGFSKSEMKTLKGLDSLKSIESISTKVENYLRDHPKRYSDLLNEFATHEIEESKSQKRYSSELNLYTKMNKAFSILDRKFKNSKDLQVWNNQIGNGLMNIVDSGRIPQFWEDLAKNDRKLNKKEKNDPFLSKVSKEWIKTLDRRRAAEAASHR